MASVCNDPNGRRRILFVDPDGDRKAIHLGKIDRKTAESVCRHVEALLASKITGQPLERSTAVWLVDIGDKLKEKLAKVGLIDPLEGSGSLPLASFLSDYLSRQTHIKSASLLAVKQAVRNLLDYFGDGRRMDSISAGEADDFRKWLLSGGRSNRQTLKPKALAPATVGKRLSYCVSIFGDARKRKLITENPFDGIKIPGATNKERQAYVPVATIETIIEQAPSAEWRLLLAMSRYLGVRVPSEPFSMTWDGVDWDRSRLRVPSPKTAVHGKSFRMVPILPAVMIHLQDVHELAPEGSTYIFHKLRERDSVRQAEKGFWASLNLRQQLLRMLTRAGFKPWPRLWHSLRSSAQTDLANRLPAHVVCEWLGNTQAVAKDHYLQVTDAHYLQALEGEKGSAKNSAGSGETAQKTAQQSPAVNRKDENEEIVSVDMNQVYAELSDSMPFSEQIFSRADRI